ncbi:MAG TPA: TauD/TfdA family dioxygenase [Alphaproteobacteria bacterium]|nr:TauD/TfdA family dioxygenase [Alphaproteobacteria bacterium]
MVEAIPLSDLLGVEIRGIDVTRPLAAAERTALLDAFHQGQVIVIRGQNPTPRQYIDFCRNFGELEPFFISAYNLPDHPEIYVLSNVRQDGRPVGRDGAGTHWHTDHTFMERPASVTLLHGVQVPRTGGDTLFADMYRAYDELDPATKAMLEGRRAIHRYQKKEFVFSAERDLDPEQAERIRRLQELRRREEAGAAPSPTAQKSNAHPDQLHPIVRTHPVTGRKALYLNDEMTVGIEGMPEAEGQALLRRLCVEATRPERVFRFKWQPGDIVAWDNASTLHSATYTDPAEARTMYRVTIQGTKPV